MERMIANKAEAQGQGRRSDNRSRRWPELSILKSMDILFAILTLVLAPCLMGFYVLDSIRVSAVRGSHARYKLTGIVWTLLWPAYGCAAMWMLRGIIHHDMFAAVLTPLHFIFITIRYQRLKKDDDDNPWRKLKGWVKTKVKAGVKKLRQVKVPVPQLGPPVGAGAGA